MVIGKESELGNKVSVIIVDEQGLIRDTWALLLTSTGKYEVVEKTGNGDEAAEMVRNSRPDIAVIDINMTPTGNLESLRLIT
jgi:chemotaxis response regulator CheB